MKSRRRFLFHFFAAALIAFTTGCDPLHAPVVGEDSDDAPEFDLAIPAEVVQAWSAAFSSKDYVAYEALLADEFEFFPRDEDANDFPWMTGDSWGRATELGIVNNMFDPNFSGGQTAITNITTSAFFQSQSTNGQGRPELTYRLSGQILMSPTDGFGFDTWIKVELVSVGGKFEISRMTELGWYAGPTSRIEETSFGSIKNLYR